MSLGSPNRKRAQRFDPTSAKSTGRKLQLCLTDQREHLIIGHRKNLIRWLRFNSVGAGEFAERRKHSHGFIENKTWDLRQRISSASEIHRRVDVSGKFKNTARHNRFGIVTQPDPVNQQWLFDDSHLQLMKQSSLAEIVITHNQRHVNVLVRFTPRQQFGNKIFLVTGKGMTEVTQEIERRRLRLLNGIADLPKHHIGSASGNRNAFISKRSGFAKMCIGQQNCLLRWPENCLIGQ